MENIYAVIRVRGSAKKNKEAEYTLGLLNLKKPNNCILLPKRPDIMGTLKSVENFITWGEIDIMTKELLVEKRAGGKGQENQKVFRLSPPSKGHKSVKMLFPRGACGYRGDKINELLERMI